MNRSRRLVATVVLVSGLLAGAANGQSIDWNHSWSHGVGSQTATHSDFGRGVGVLPDGVVVGTGLHMIADGVQQHPITGVPDPSWLETARDAVIASAYIDHIYGYAVQDETDPTLIVDRQYLIDHMIASDNPAGIGFALETPNVNPNDPHGYFHPEFSDLLARYLSRSAFCPGDYNRDGAVNNADAVEFLDDLGNEVPYADWNFDGEFDSADWTMFQAAWNAGCCQ